MLFYTQLCFVFLQVGLQDYNEVTHGLGSTNAYPVMKDRPQSSGPSGRRPTITKAISISFYKLSVCVCVHPAVIGYLAFAGMQIQGLFS